MQLVLPLRLVYSNFASILKRTQRQIFGHVGMPHARLVLLYIALFFDGLQRFFEVMTYEFTHNVARHLSVGLRQLGGGYFGDIRMS